MKKRIKNINEDGEIEYFESGETVTKPKEKIEKTNYTTFELDAIVKLTNAGGYALTEKGLILYSTDLPIPDEADYISLAKELESKYNKENTIKLIIELCTDLTLRIKTFLSNKYITPDQQERYSIKAQAAKENKIEFFVDEASLLGIEPEVLMASVKEMTLKWEHALNLASIKIDAVRVYLNSLIETDIKFVNYVIEQFKNDVSKLTLDTPILDTINKLKQEFDSLDDEVYTDLTGEDTIVE